MWFHKDLVLVNSSIPNEKVVFCDKIVELYWFTGFYT